MEKIILRWVIAKLGLKICFSFLFFHFFYLTSEGFLFFISFLLKIDSSFIQYVQITVSPCSTRITSLQPILSLLSIYQNEQASENSNQTDKAKTLTKKKSLYWYWMRQPSRMKGSQEQGNVLEKHLLPLLGVPQYPQTNNYSALAEGVGHTHSGHTLPVLVSFITFGI